MTGFLSAIGKAHSRRHSLPAHRGTPLFTLVLIFAFPAPAALAASRPLPLWQVRDSQGHVLYLVGAMHALRPQDYPLPTAITEAFAHSDRLVEELDLTSLSPAKSASTLAQKGNLPASETLAAAMNGDWNRAQALARKAGVNLGLYRNFKPWLAATEIADRAIGDAGYHPDLGVDRYFSGLAQRRHMPVTGLETFAEQLGFFAALPLATQRRFLLQTLRDAPRTPKELARLHAAWASGDLATLAAIEREDFAAYPDLRQTLLDRRNERWLNVLEQCLAGGEICVVVVGVEHMAGAKGLPALLSAAGYRVTQIGREPAKASVSAAGAPGA